jgi:hypothetical protein
MGVDRVDIHPHADYEDLLDLDRFGPWNGPPPPIIAFRAGTTPVPLYPFALYDSSAGFWGTITGLNAAHRCVREKGFRDAIRERDDPLIVGNILGCAAFIEGRIRDALRHFRTAAAARSFGTQAHYNLIAALLSDGRIVQAAEVLGKWDEWLSGQAGIEGLVTWEKLDASPAIFTRFEDIRNASPEVVRSLIDLGTWIPSWIVYCLYINDSDLGIHKALAGSPALTPRKEWESFDQIDGHDTLLLASELVRRAGHHELARSMTDHAEWLCTLT